MFLRNLFGTFLGAVTFTLLLILSQAAISAPSFEERDIGDVGWSVVLISSSYDPVTNTTTFTYQLTATTDEKDLSHWVLNIDGDESPISAVSPEELTSYGLDPTTGVWGIKWDAGQDAGTTRIYTVTVYGNVSSIDVDYAVKGGTYYAIGTTQGPGSSIPNSSTYSLSGVIFVDANPNLSFDIGEPLIGSVTVELYDDAGNLTASMLSDEFGYYEFSGLIPGDYRVVIPQSSIADDFNHVLFDYLTAVSPVELSANISDANITDLNFGFGMNVQAIIADLDSSDPDYDGFTFPGEGRTIGYWKHQLSVAIKGKGRAQVDAATVLSYLHMIESYLLPIPFQFNDGDEFGHAFSIMANRTNVAVELLEKQLLGTELNQFAGLGLAGDYAMLQHLILAWSEYLVSNHELYSRETLLEAKDILDFINNHGH